MEQLRPLDALNKARHKRVLIELKNGKQFLGNLKAFDVHINVVLEEAEERVDGEIKRKLGTIFLRGDTIILIAPQWFKWVKEHLLWERSLEKRHILFVEDAMGILCIKEKKNVVVVASEKLQN